MRRIRSLLIALAIVGGSVAVAAFLVSLAPEPERLEPPSQLSFVTATAVAAGSGPIPVQRGDDEVYVTGALEDGQAVITGGIQFATAGMRVRTAAAPDP